MTLSMGKGSKGNTFGLKELFAEPLADRLDLGSATDGRTQLLLEVATLERDEATTSASLDELEQVRQRHYGTRYSIVKLLLDLLNTSMAHLHILQANGIGHLLSDSQFLVDTIDEQELAVGI